MAPMVAIPSNQRNNSSSSSGSGPGSSAFHPTTVSHTTPFKSPTSSSSFERTSPPPSATSRRMYTRADSPLKREASSINGVSDSVLAAADTLSNMSLFSSHKGSGTGTTSPVKPSPHGRGGRGQFEQHLEPVREAADAATAAADHNTPPPRNSLPADLLASIQPPPPSMSLAPMCDVHDEPGEHRAPPPMASPRSATPRSRSGYEPHTPYRARARTPDPENMMIAAVEKRQVGSTGGNYSLFNKHQHRSAVEAAAAYASKRRSVMRMAAAAAATTGVSHHNHHHSQSHSRGTSHSPARYDGPFQIPHVSPSMSRLSTRSPSPVRSPGGMRTCSSFPSFHHIHEMPSHAYYSPSSSSGKRSRTQSRSSRDEAMEDDRYAHHPPPPLSSLHQASSSAYDEQPYTKRRAFAHSSGLPPADRYSSSHHSTDDERRSSTSSDVPPPLAYGGPRRRPHAHREEAEKSSSSCSTSRSPSYTRGGHSSQHPSSHRQQAPRSVHSPPPAFAPPSTLQSMRKSASVPEFLFAQGVLPRSTLPGMSPVVTRPRSYSKSPPRTLTSPPHAAHHDISRGSSSQRSSSPDRMSITSSESSTSSSHRLPAAFDAMPASMSAAATAAALQHAALAAAAAGTAAGAHHHQLAQSLQAAAVASSAAAASTSSLSSSGSGSGSSAAAAANDSLMSVLATMAAVNISQAASDATAPKRGISCHRCKRAHDIQELKQCERSMIPSLHEQRSCRKKFCQRCLRKFYAAHPHLRNESPWLCPACRGICMCAACKRKLPPGVFEKICAQEGIKPRKARKSAATSKASSK